MKQNNRKKAAWIFAVTFLMVLAVLAAAMLKTSAYNHTRHHADLPGTAVFSERGARAEGISVTAAPRGSTWTKVFDLYDEGLTEHNYQAFTYDFTFANKTKDEVSDFVFRLGFRHDAFLSSAWNGALEIHQNTASGEAVAYIPDLRDYDPADYALNYFTVDGETLIAMKDGDYLVYYPSTGMNAMEIPIKANEGTTPGFIMYVPIGASIEDSSLALDFTFHRLLTGEPLFWVSLAGLAVWLVAALVFSIFDEPSKGK